MILRFIFWVIILCFILPAQARVFDFKDEGVASYLNLRTGLSSAGNQAFRWQTPASYSGDDFDFLYGGDFGLYLRSGSLNVSIGMLVQSMDPVTGAKASDATGVELFSLDSKAMVFGPTMQFEYEFSKSSNYHWYLSLGGGYQFAKIENSYTYSVAGQALSGNLASRNETLKAQIPFANLAIGAEMHMSGATTLHLALGYHYSLASDWSYGEGGANFSGTHEQGDKVQFEDGSSNQILWSYPYIQLGFRFYIDIVR